MISTGYIPVAKHLQLGSLWTTFETMAYRGQSQTGIGQLQNPR